jgi:hypothetical protein
MPQDEALVVSGVGSDGTKIYLTLWLDNKLEAPIRIVKELTPMEAIKLGARIIQEATPLL